MDEATYLVAQALIECIESDPNAKLESIHHSDWFNGLVDHLLAHERRSKRDYHASLLRFRNAIDQLSQQSQDS